MSGVESAASRAFNIMGSSVVLWERYDQFGVTTAGYSRSSAAPGEEQSFLLWTGVRQFCGRRRAREFLPVAISATCVHARRLWTG